MKLYELTIKAYVVAKDENEVCNVRIDASAADTLVIEAESVDDNWGDSLPFSDYGVEEHTCSEWLALMEEEKRCVAQIELQRKLQMRLDGF